MRGHPRWLCAYDAHAVGARQRQARRSTGGKEAFDLRYDGLIPPPGWLLFGRNLDLRHSCGTSRPRRGTPGTAAYDGLGGGHRDRLAGCDATKQVLEERCTQGL